MDWLTWSALEGFINQRLTAIGTLVSIVSFIPIAWTCWEVTIGRKQRHRRWLNEIQRSPGERPAILIVDLLEKGDIATSVESYRQHHERLRTIPPGRIFKVRQEKHLTPSDMPALVRDIRRVTSEVIRAGTDTLHLFYAGPVVPMALIGAEFANGCQLILYQHERGDYLSWGPLRHNLE